MRVIVDPNFTKKRHVVSRVRHNTLTQAAKGIILSCILYLCIFYLVHKDKRRFI